MNFKNLIMGSLNSNIWKKQKDVSIVELRKKSREMGMRSMREDGFRKVMAGVTTLDEVLMVTTESD